MMYYMFSVPEDVCLLGCIFYIADYQKCLQHATLNIWRQVINTYFILYFQPVFCTTFCVVCILCLHVDV